MRLSLWQQFASNHSNSFVVVGQFDDEHKAFAAYLQLRRVLRQLVELDEHGDLEPLELTGEAGWQVYQATLGQTAIFQPFGIVPHRWIDWVTYSMAAERIDNALHLFHNHLYLDDPVVGYSGVEPFDRLISALGSQAVYAAEDEKRPLLAIDLVCTTPDEAVAKHILQALRFDTTRPIPWLPYHGGKYQPDAEEIQQKEFRLLAWENWTAEVRQLKDEYEQTPRWKRPEFIKQVEQAEYNPPDVAELDSDEKWALERLRENVTFQQEYLSVVRENQVLRLTNLFFPAGRVGIGFPALLEWMKSQGCSVQYTFKYISLMTVVTATADTPEMARQLAQALQIGGINRGYKTLSLAANDRVEVVDEHLTVIVYSDDGYDVYWFLHDRKCRKVDVLYYPVPWKA